MNSSLNILGVTDNRDGHRRQVQALVEALGRSREIRDEQIRPLSRGDQMRAHLRLGHPPDVHLIIGAGHATHTSLLALGRATGAPTVVLMRPSLPRWLFDLCLIPDHDNVAETERIIRTRGVLSPVQPRSEPVSHPPVALIGGPVKHHAWDAAQVWTALRAWAEGADQPVTVVTSARTPKRFLELAPDDLEHRIRTPQETAPDWLDRVLPVSSRIAVTADSLSMQADALASGRPASLLAPGIALPRRHQRAVDRFPEHLNAAPGSRTAADEAAERLLAWWDRRANQA